MVQEYAGKLWAVILSFLLGSISNYYQSLVKKKYIYLYIYI